MKKLVALAFMAIALGGCVSKPVSDKDRLADVIVRYKAKECTRVELDDSTSKYYCKDGSTIDIMVSVTHTNVVWTSPDRQNRYGGWVDVPTTSDIRW